MTEIKLLVYFGEGNALTRDIGSATIPNDIQ